MAWTISSKGLAYIITLYTITSLFAIYLVWENFIIYYYSLLKQKTWNIMEKDIFNYSPTIMFLGTPSRIIFWNRWDIQHRISKRYRIWKIKVVSRTHLFRFSLACPSFDTGCPKNMGIQWRIRYRLCYELTV